MNTFAVLIVVIMLLWAGIYTVSYGVWTFRENKKGGISLFILAVICVVFPLYLLWLRK
ncbi:hypothetical protein ODU73_001545 [Thermoclostridium stercorarium]|jgi:uncharacterized membrane protein|uniref:hypothetical protein n=1 Tax=Thermoclostridium stercorarium TaxID=1510 RepID=UPI0002C5AE93|nr:hypothetical protein [Thermoclostridium stercorarium]AGI39547.1 hypothetical protein Clst_1491 [Thermoclostridium stercorarium subsp. stercorarium DSM 8532]UZQ84517.1 hypothetical protein ODU73_001545 [Thermoclostridium stercorarium]